MFTNGKAWKEEWRYEWSDARGNPHDQWSFGYDPVGNCTSFVAWRLNQLSQAMGLADWKFSNGGVTTPDGFKQAGTIRGAPRFGNGAEWIDSARQIGIPTGDRPTVGAVAVWPGDHANYGARGNGHVAIVKEVRADGSIVIEESLFGKEPFRETVIPPPPDSRYPKDFIYFLPGTTPT